MTRRTNVPPSAPILLRVNEAAEMLGLCRATLYELMASGALDSVKIGRARRIPRESLDAFIADRLAVRDE